MPRSRFDSSSGRNDTQGEGVVPGRNNTQGDRSRSSFHPYQAFTRVDAPSGQQHYENYPDSAHSTHSASQFSRPYGEIRTQPPNTDARPPTATSASQFMTNVGDAQIGSDLAWMDGSHMLRLDLTAHARVEQPATEYARGTPKDISPEGNLLKRKAPSGSMHEGFRKDAYKFATAPEHEASESEYEPEPATPRRKKPTTVADSLGASSRHQQSYEDLSLFGPRDQIDRQIAQGTTQSDQQAKDTKEATLKKIDLNLSTRFRSSERRAKGRQEENIYDKAEILDDYIGRVASGQKQTYTIDQAFEALGSVRDFLDTAHSHAIKGGGDSRRAAFKKHLESV